MLDGVGCGAYRYMYITEKHKTYMYTFSRNTENWLYAKMKIRLNTEKLLNDMEFPYPTKFRVFMHHTLFFSQQFSLLRVRVFFPA